MKDPIQNFLFKIQELTFELIKEYSAYIRDHKIAISNLLFDIENHYATYPEACDSYSRLGCILMYQNKHQQALDLFEKDANLNKQTWWLQIRYAACMAHLDDIDSAVQLVKDIYRNHTTATNGFSALAIVLSSHNKTEDAIKMLRLDLDNARITPGFRLNAAVLLFKANHQDEAIQQVIKAYELDLSLKNGFARLGHECYISRNNSDAEQFYTREIQAKRISPSYLLKYADLLISMDQYERAIEAVERACNEEKSFLHRFAHIANNFYSNMNYEGALLFYKKADSMDHLSARDRIIYAKLLAREGRWGQAANNVQKAYNDRSKTAAFLHENITTRTIISNIQSTYGEHVSIADQWDYLEYLQLSKDSIEDPVPILNSELYISCIRDALIQFREIVLLENYYFKSDSSSPVIIDGGGNFGMAVAYFKWLYPDASITVFEPHPDNYALCEKNIQHNKWHNVMVYPYALMDSTGKVSFNILNEIPMGSGVTSRLCDALPQLTSNSIEVECRTLSEFITDSVDYLKLDIEGAEARVFLQCVDYLHHVHAGFIEYHYAFNEKCNFLSELLDVLERKGLYYHITEPSSNSFRLPLNGIIMTEERHWSASIFWHRTNEERSQ